MKKFLLLYVFASLAVCDSLEEMSEKGFDYGMQSDEWILEIFMIIIALLGVLFLFSLLHINMYTKKQGSTKQIDKNKKIDTMIVEKGKHEVDICMALNLNFPLLHEKAAKQNNSVFFIFDNKVPRNIVINHTYSISIFFTLAEFMLDEVSDSAVIISVVPLQINENDVKYKFLVKTNRLLPELKDGLLGDILKGKEKLLRYKKLNFILNKANQLHIAIEFKNMQKYSEFSFTSTFEYAKRLEPVYLPDLRKQKAVILEHDKNSFFVLSTKLAKMGIKVFNCYEPDEIKKHLQNSIFSTNYVFLNTRLLRSFTKTEIAELAQCKKEHNFKLILISDNQKYDNIASEIEHDCFLKRPFSMDAFFAGIVSN